MVLPLGSYPFAGSSVSLLAFIVWGGTNGVKDDVFILDERCPLKMGSLYEEVVKHTKGGNASLSKKRLKCFPGIIRLILRE